MNDHWSAERAAASVAPSGGIAFTGTWREYLPIALSNALLTVVTLGIYRFWASARQRRYLWSRTVVIDDPLEWTGTGKEMFVGFLVVMCILLPSICSSSSPFRRWSRAARVRRRAVSSLCSTSP